MERKRFQIIETVYEIHQANSSKLAIWKFDQYAVHLGTSRVESNSIRASFTSVLRRL
jgi:hypothetical protein